MDQKLYVYNGKTSFLCPACNKMTTMTVSEFMGMGSIVHLSCRCACGFSSTALLERRNYIRREITLPGISSRYKQGQKIEKIPIVVTEISLSGLRFTPHMEPGFIIGDHLWIKFNLNDPEKSLIKKEATVVNMRSKQQVGVEFRIKENAGPLNSFLFG